MISRRVTALQLLCIMAEEATAVPETMEEPRSPEVEREPTPRTRYEKIAKSVQDKQVHRQAREASMP